MSNNTSKINLLVAEKWCHTRINKIHECSYAWTIHNYLDYHYHSSNSIESSKFKSKTNDECIWNLRLTGVSYGGEIRLVLNSDADWCKDVLVKWKMYIINGEGDETNINKHTYYCTLSKSDGSYYISFPSFLTREKILVEKMLSGDKLIIFCEFQFIIKGSEGDSIQNVSGGTVDSAENVLDCDLHFDLERLFLSEDFSDLVISVGEKKYQVHKNILAARSKVFASMFKYDMKEPNQNHINITDMDANVVEEMLRYIYTGKSSKLDDIAFDMLPAADKYDLKRLKIMCEYSLMKKISVKNAVDILILADLYSSKVLKEKAIQFIVCSIESVKKTESWHNLKKEPNLFECIMDALLP